MTRFNIRERIRCAVCSAICGFCNCPEDSPYQTTTDAAPRQCNCPDKVEPPTEHKETIRERFERFCDENPDHHDCRIYD